MKTLDCNYKMLNPEIISGDNCYLIDKNGKKYLDFESGVWCTSLGHNNKNINMAILDQMNMISHTGYRYTTEIVNEVLSVIESGACIENAGKLGLVLGDSLKKLAEKHKDHIREVRGTGLMYAAEFMKHIPLEELHKKLFDAGFITGINTAANLMRFYPPLTITEEQIGEITDALDLILRQYKRDC